MDRLGKELLFTVAEMGLEFNTFFDKVFMTKYFLTCITCTSRVANSTYKHYISKQHFRVMFFCVGICEQ